MIRRLAEEFTVGKEQIQYEDKALNPRKPTRRTRFLYDCTRLVIRNMKKRYKEQAA